MGSEPTGTEQADASKTFNSPPDSKPLRAMGTITNRWTVRCDELCPGTQPLKCARRASVSLERIKSAPIVRPGFDFRHLLCGRLDKQPLNGCQRTPVRSLAPACAA